jgi:hypothetical protein
MAALVLVSISSSAKATDAPTHAIHPDAPWARGIDDELSKPLLEQWYGKDAADKLRASGVRLKSGNVVLTGESLDQALLDAHDLPPPPIPAQAYEASPGVLFVNFGGVTVEPDCPTSEIANAALNCSPLVPSTTTFPSWGDANQRAGVMQTLRNYYEPYNLTIIDSRPPDWLPYTMAIVGGSSGDIGLGGACGVANVQCDGLKRNHVSLNFTNCGSGAIPETIAQETSHNWGLEHTNNPTDLLFPSVTGGFKEFVDSCMAIEANMGNPVSCGYVHEIHCPGGAGDQQNSHAELLGVFGPRMTDDEAPVLVSISPEDGAVFSTEDIIGVGASVDDNSTFIGIKWTWLEGLPDGIDEYTRCTNNVCTEGYNPGVQFEPADMPWDFVVLEGPPVGTYTFQIEAFDAGGNGLTEQITFTVVPPGEVPDDSGGADDSGSASAGDDGAGTAGDGAGGTAGDGGGTDAGGDGGRGDDGGGCRLEPASPSWWLGLPLMLLLVRRRD